MKMKKVLPLLMAAVMMTSVIPMTAGATDASASSQDTAAAEPAEGTTGTQDSAAAETENSTDAASGNVQNESGSADTASDTSPDSSADAEETENTSPADSDSADTESAEEQNTDTGKTSGKVVTLGENLNDQQRASMYEYFGTSADEVQTIVVTHADEVKYMEGIATAEQIGPTTNSCAYVEPTESGGIKVKTANLNYVTSAMIASTLTTAGMENCNVIAACPFEVSGTGALTGIIMAYEKASGENLDEGQKEAAMEELVTTGDIADSVGQEKATEIMKDVKTEVIDEGLTDPEEIGEAVDSIAKDNEVTLTDDQRAQVVSLMEKISQYDYDVNALKDTLNNLTGDTGVISNIWNSVKSFFVGSDDGILSGTNDEALGSDVITDSTVNESGFKDGLLTRIKNFFTGQ